MRRRKRRRVKIGNMSIIYISTILALSFMGVGYAAWNDGLNINMSITTTDIFPEHDISNIPKIELDDEEWINITLSDDKQTVYIKGEVFSSFNSSIPIEVKDKGGIPTKLINIDRFDDAEITELKEEAKSKYSRQMSFVDEDIVKSLDLSIYPENDKNSNNDNSMVQKFSIMEQDEISILQYKIEEYKEIKEYHFNYEILLEQAL